MKKIWKWLKKHLKCLNEGHDYYYNEYAGYFLCKRCGKANKFATWSKEE